jgi:hypothetical protein
MQNEDVLLIQMERVVFYYQKKTVSLNTKWHARLTRGTCLTAPTLVSSSSSLLLHGFFYTSKKTVSLNTECHAWLTRQTCPTARQIRDSGEVRQIEFSESYIPRGHSYRSGDSNFLAQQLCSS